MAGHKTIHVHHLTRVEGHGDIVAEIRDGEVVEVRFDVVEAPRFFEVFLRGQPADDVVHLASRICGICAVSHRCAALKAAESAMAVAVSPQTELLRRIAYYGEVLSSHILHIYFLAAPDFFGVPSIFPLVSTHREMVERAMRLKKLGYDLSAAVAGRHTHPVGMAVGGFSFVHDKRRLEEMKERLSAAEADIRATVETFQEIPVPDFRRETEYVALRHPDHYGFYDGEIRSSEGWRAGPEAYREVIEEYVVDHSTAKHARCRRPQFMVGALARVNNNHDQLSPLARETMAGLGLDPPRHNPFLNTAAQIVECAHCIEEGPKLIASLLEKGIDPSLERTEPEFRAGRGVGVVEAPRGLLIHDYTYDEAGVCTDANMVIPTAQNLANLEADLRAYVPTIAGSETDRLTHQMEILVRAYDPCISCSTHVIDLTG